MSVPSATRILLVATGIQETTEGLNLINREAEKNVAVCDALLLPETKTKNKASGEQHRGRVF